MLTTLRNRQDSELLADIRDVSLYGRGDEKLGSVEDAVFDLETGAVHYLIVDAGWLNKPRFVIPADQVYAYADRDEFYSNLSKQDVESLPEFHDESLMSAETFTNYEREYKNAWRYNADSARMQPSGRLARLRARLRTLVSLDKNEKRQALADKPATYSGTHLHPATGVYGVFSKRKDVELAVNKVKEQGFESDQISVLFPNPEITKEFAVEQNTKAPEGALAGGGTGLVVGGALGWLAGIGTLALPGVGPLLAAGPIVAALAGAGVGSAIGGIAGALIGLGLPELEAKRYETAVKKGRILVSIHCDDVRQAERARKLLEDSDATDVFLSGEARAA
jgi:hypothetical protein